MLVDKRNSSGHRIAAVYLARMAEGLAPLQKFVRSYASHAAGIEHDLVVIYKGFDQAAKLEDAKGVFSSIPHLAIEVPDEGFDIGAYLATAAKLDHDYVCFMNTFSEIEADDWLSNLYRHASAPGVGIVGAMGSYESLSASSRLIHKVLWLCNEAAVPYDAKMAYYFDYVINDHCRVWKAGSAGNAAASWKALILSPRQVYRRLRAYLRFTLDVIGGSKDFGSLDTRFQRRWARRLAPGGDMAEMTRFPVFPNPHIRSNGFMVARKHMLEFPAGSIKTKMDACAFESGADSLTSRLRRQGLAALVVGKDGAGYDVKDWWSSGTFRCMDEGNLLVSDNQSRMFRPMTPGTKLTHLRITWGDYLGSAPGDFPDLGFHFPINAEITGLPQARKEMVNQ